MASYTFSNGETGYGIILNDGDQMEIRNGGFAENTGVTVGGKLTVLNGGLADTVHLDGGTLEVLTGGTAANVYFTWTIDEDSEVTIRVDGGEINGLAGETITSWWYKTMSIRITDDGVLRNANFEQYYPDDGFLVLSNGGTLEDSRLNNFSLTVSEGGIVQSTELRAWDRTHSILNSGLFVDVSFFGGEQGVLNIYDGGRAVRTSVESGTIVLSGGRASETRLGEKGVLLLSSGGLADATTILKGEMHVLSGGTATGAILPGEYNRWGGGGIDSIGPMHISEGGLGLGTKIAGGTQTVFRGGTASGTEITLFGSQLVLTDGVTSEVVLSDGGHLIVNGGLAQGVHAVRHGAVEVGNGGRIQDATIETRNMMFVSSGGRAEDVNLASGGEVYLLNGAVLGGRLVMADGAIVSAYEGGAIDFDLSKANGTTALIGNLSAITGAPGFTLTVSADASEGTYLLADGSSGFSGSITVQDATAKYGSLTVDNPLVCGWNTYTLNLNDGTLSLTVSRNDTYHEPANEELEPEEIIVSSGTEVASGNALVWEKTGETVRIVSGGVLGDLEIPWGGTLILEENAILQGTVRIGADVVVEGVVNASEANLELDISRRKEEYGILLSNLAFVTAATYTVIVDPDQNKGAYILAGNAQDFNGVITVKSTDGTNRGTITVEQGTLDYGITQYSLTKNGNNELVFIVSSNITDETDSILLSKNNRLVLAKESEFDQTLSCAGEFDQMTVLDRGVAEMIAIEDEGLVTVQAGGRLLVSELQENGRLNFEYTAGDTTVIKGINLYGAFSVENDVLENVYGYNVTVSGDVQINNYHGHTYGRLTAMDGLEMTGTVEGGEYCFYGAWVHDFTLERNGYGWSYLYDGTVAQNTVWNNERIIVGDADNNRILVENTVFNGNVELYGGTFSNVTFNSGIVLNGYVVFESDLYLKSKPDYGPIYLPRGLFDMNGHTVTLDYTGNNAGCEAMISLDCFSEDTVFQLNLRENQMPGKYAIATEARRGSGTETGVVDTFNISVNGEIIGAIDGSRTEFVHGNYVYTMTYEDDLDPKLYLTIDISEDADETFGVYWFDLENNFHHAASVNGQDFDYDNFNGYNGLTVRNHGVVTDFELREGCSITVQAGGEVTGLVQSGSESKLIFAYTAGDTTVINGINPYGAFSVENDVLENVYGYNVTVSGDVQINNYHGHTYGRLTAMDGFEMTGAVDGGEYWFYDSWVHDFTLERNGYGWSYLCKGSTVQNAVWNNDNVVVGDSQIPTEENTILVENTVFNRKVDLFGGTFSNVTFNSEIGIYRSITFESDLSLKGRPNYGSYGIFHMNGHTVTLDYTDHYTGSEAIVSMVHFSEDVNFRVMLRKDQKIGTYILANHAGALTDYFLLNIDGVDTETLSAENMEMTYGNYHYTLNHDIDTQNITLTIDFSENADETFGVYWFDLENNFHHAASVNGQDFDYGNYDGSNGLTVRNHGVVTDFDLNLQEGCSITVQAGGEVTGLIQSYPESKLNFTYTAGDTTVINGVNPYGAFSVGNNVLENVYGYNVTVSGDVQINNYHGHTYGRLTMRDGLEMTGTVDGGEYCFYGAWVHDFTLERNGYGWSYLYDGTVAQNTVWKNDRVVVGSDDVRMENAVFNGHADLYGGTFSNVTFNSEIVLMGGTYSDTDIYSSCNIDGFIYLDGDITFRAGGNIRNTPGYAPGAIEGNGNTITLDFTNRTVADSAMLNLDRVYNADLRIVMEQTKMIGTFVIGSSASQIGQVEEQGVYDWTLNQWLFLGETIGDQDGIISIYDTNGIELANCTVNGDTEYYGRSNYTVFVDDDGCLKLKVGWNNRSSLTYSADELEYNDTMETATVIGGSGADLPTLTIHSADDVDWFKFDLETTGRKSHYIGIDFKQWAGDLDINLYNSNGELINYARSVTDNERLSLSGYTAGTYYMQVSGYSGNTNAYKLNCNLPEPVVLTDEYENGNTPLSAIPLWTIDGTRTIHAAIQNGNDVDYYSFVLERGGTTADSLTLTFDAELGDLDLYLFDVNGLFVLGKSVGVGTGSETISFSGLSRGVYVAKVVGRNGDVANYDLTFHVRDDEVQPDKYDQNLKNNNSMRKATKLYTLNGEKTLDGLSIHQNDSLLGVETDVDYYRFSILEKGSADDSITLSCEASLGDLDLEILNADGEVVAYSRTAENDDVVSLKGLDAGEYYIRVCGYNNAANNYSLSWHVTNSSLIPSDPYEGIEPILIREDQTISGLSIAKVREDDETREDTFRIVLEYDAWKRSRIILTDYRSDWEDGMAYVIRDADGNVLMEGTDSEISLYGLKKGEYYLTLDAPNEDEYSEYSLIAQNLPDSDNAKNNTWSVFIYIAGDNNLESGYLTDLWFMQSAVLPENVEVYVLFDRSPEYTTAERDWTDTRVGRIRHSSGGAIAVQWMYFNGADTDTYVNAYNTELQREWDTGDVATLEAFLDWGMKEGRADNYALIMSDHGSSLGYNCEDDTDGSILAIDEIADLLRADKYEDLSVAAFEQCLMGSDIVITTMEGTVDYVVASEATGYGPNLSLMYGVLLNSLESEMSPQELSQKIVAACNCSGTIDLTMASFKSDDHTLSDALNQFGELSKQFTYNDWVTLCKCYSRAHNYGDLICAYSDLGSILNMIKGYHETISSTLLDAANALYDTVMNTVIDSTQITPDIYGTGLAVFNPVLSDSMMVLYSYGTDSTLDYYATEIGRSSWGGFLYTLSKMADDCSPYIVDKSGNLTFTDYSYYYEKGEIRTSYNLGAFSGDGVTYEGLYIDRAAYFDIMLMQPGRDGDAIVITADNPDAEITISLTQTLIPTVDQLENDVEPQAAIRRVSENGVLSLAGIDWKKNRAEDTYYLCIKSTEETTYTMKFVGEWTGGVDYFDYARTGSIDPLAAGNNSIDKATSLSNGNYGGLVTCAGDKDFYRILSVYANNIDVTVKGTGLVVQEFNADGELLQTAAEESGVYKLIVGKGNYVCVEGTADISVNECDSYMLTVSDAAQKYLKPELTAVLPGKPVVTGELNNNRVTVTVSVDDGMKGYQSSDLQVWNLCENNVFVAEENGLYYFKSVDPETDLESKYTSLRVVGIDSVPPTVSSVAADVTAITNGDVIVTAEFADDVALASSLYRIGEEGEWLDYDAENGVIITENATVYFKAVDLAGNESEIVSYEVKNIDKVAPIIELVGDNTTPLQSSTLTAVTEAGLDIYVSTDNASWTKYEGPLNITSNGTYFFMATDAAGNVGTADFTFANIDTTAPEAPTASADIAAATNQNVTVTAVFSVDSVVREYSLDGTTWLAYTEPITFEENGSVLFRGTDEAGNMSEVTTCEVRNIDKLAPLAPVASADVTVPTNGDVTVSATFSDDSVTKEYSLDGQNWLAYTAALILSENGTVFFRGADEAGNVSEITNFLVNNIDKTAPEKPLVSADITTPTNRNVTVMAVFSEDSVVKEYSFDRETWIAYTEALVLTENGTVFFRGTDAAGNVSAEETYTVDCIDKEPPVIVLSGDNTTSLQASTLIATTEPGLDIYVSTDNESWTKYEGEIAVTANGTFFFKATDAAGNIGTASIVFGNIHAAENVPENLVGTPEKVSWESTGAKQYIVEYSTDNFAHVIQMVTTSLAADLLDLPAGTYQWRVKADNGEEWAVGETIVSEVESSEPKVVQSNEDGNDDLFFASTSGTWENIYCAQHVGSINDWNGTYDLISAGGKGRIQNLFFGSADPNVLCLTDGENGDAIFVDDVYTELPEGIEENMARLYRIQEVRAGAGDDIVDMTSQRFEYVGDGMTIRGGDGDDTIWANKGDNMLFGDAGNDRIVGASSNDVIAGGIGNDRMHGGGGTDVFAFCDNWGSDEVKQLATGTVTLWFISGSESNWNASTLTYTDGENSVKVSGVTADKINLKFGDDGSAQFAMLSDNGAFDAFTSQKIFEESDKGILASL